MEIWGLFNARNLRQLFKNSPTNIQKCVKEVYVEKNEHNKCGKNIFKKNTVFGVNKLMHLVRHASFCT